MSNFKFISAKANDNGSLDVNISNGEVTYMFQGQLISFDSDKYANQSDTLTLNLDGEFKNK